MKYPRLAARIFNTPLLVHPQKLDAIVAGLGSRLLGTTLASDMDLDALEPTLFSTRKGTPDKTGDYQIIDGVAVINVGGVLVHRSRMEADSSYLLGYNDIAANLDHALQNVDAHAVLMVFDSPGGEVNGAFELADRIRAARGQKPLVAIADTTMASAAYLAASGADQIVAANISQIGSIGVVAQHVDLSRALANEGIQVTHIFAGAHKIDGTAFAPLPDAVRADVQAEINAIYDLFVKTVAANRGIPEQAVRATEAAVYRGDQAIAQGLADRIGATDNLLAELAALRSTRAYSLPNHPSVSAALSTTSPHGGNTMNSIKEMQTAHPSLCAQLASEATAATLASLTAESLLAGNSAVHAALLADGAGAERTRILAIQAHGNRFPGHGALVASLIAGGKSAPEAAEAILAAEGGKLDAAAAALITGAPQPVAHAAAESDLGNAKPAADDKTREALQTKWDANAALQAEFGGRFESYVAFEQGAAYQRAA